ncbi:MAG TPA: YicC/YloC family endoribonuclease [Polyangiaceae bacterium]|nr:YicC/YloC family endoribonuclease [Polyangiaceae bacterium]
MKSMTGFGLGEAPLGGGRVAIEVRSLNHRFLEIRVRLPPEIAEQSFFVEQLARERLDRGRFDVGVRLEGAALPSVFSLDRARAAYRALAKLRDELAPGTELPVSALAAIPDLWASSPAGDAEAVRTSLRTAFDVATSNLQSMRQNEGQALGNELAARLRSAGALRDELVGQSDQMREAHRKRLRERLAHLLEDGGVRCDPGRLETEVAILADRSDVTEELVRMKSHFEQFERMLEADEPVGRRLEFLLQEIAREANTIGAKCQTAAAAHLVVELKSEIERMREQVQNVE